MKQQGEPPQHLLSAGTHKRDDLVGTQKTMPVNELDDLPVSFREPDGGDAGNAFETWISFVHPAILMANAQTMETAEFAILGKFWDGRVTPVVAPRFLRELVAVADSWLGRCPSF